VETQNLICENNGTTIRRLGIVPPKQLNSTLNKKPGVP